MKLLDFDSSKKKEWGDKQADIIPTLSKALKAFTNIGFVIAFARRNSEEGKKILALENRPTTSQRGYYWQVVIPTIRKAAAEQGQHYKNEEHLHSDIKNILMEQYSLYEEKVNLITGEVYKECYSVSDQKGNKTNTSKFIDTVINWAAEFYGIQIPEPPQKEVDTKK